MCKSLAYYVGIIGREPQNLRLHWCKVARIKSLATIVLVLLLLPLALALSSFITKYLAPEAEGHGTERVIEAVHRHDGYIIPANSLE